MGKRIQFRTEYWDHGTIFAMAATKGDRSYSQLRATVSVRFRRYRRRNRPSFKVLVDMRDKLTRHLRDAYLPTSDARKAQRRRRCNAKHPV